MAQPASNDDLLARARSGDVRALEALLQRHEAQIYRFGMKMCRNPEDAADVLQDTLLAAARHLQDFRGESSISTWLYTVARSFCLKQRRKLKAGSTFGPPVDRETPAPNPSEGAVTSAELLPHTTEASLVADPGKTPEEALAAAEVEEALSRAIAELDPGQREVLVLRDMEGLTAQEVSDVLGIGVAAVKSRLHRARLAVRAKVAPVLGVPSQPPVLRSPAANAPQTPSDPAPASCPDVLLLFSQHLEDEISADVCAEMEKHVAACPRCRGACDSLRKTLAACKHAPSPSVPAAAQQAVRAALRDALSNAPIDPIHRP